MNTIANPDHQFHALGRKSRPDTIQVNGDTYHHLTTFKHDFFAFTALYQLVTPKSSPQLAPKVVLKINREADFLGLPLVWIGSFLQSNEIRNLRQLSGIAGIPRLIGPYGSTGLVYEYIEGQSLDQSNQNQVTPSYFDKLESLLKQVHNRKMAYVDMNKRGNILLGADGHPWLIDFQISLILDWPGLLKPLANAILARLQQEDVYHLKKQKRWLLGKKRMSQEEYQQTFKTSKLIQLHRRVARPVTLLRRQVLNSLYQSGQVKPDTECIISPETDPNRWSKASRCAKNQHTASISR